MTHPGVGAPGPTVLTFGHGRLDGEALVALLREAGVRLVVDVRRHPGSRANPAAARDAVPALLAPAGIGYRWEERLGGRRRLDADARADSPDAWWRVESFRAYAAWTRSDPFRQAVRDLLADAADRPVAVMCSEAVWWRCHRRLVADVLVAGHGVPVRHLMHDGRLSAHPVSEGLRVTAEGIVWSGPNAAADTGAGAGATVT